MIEHLTRWESDPSILQRRAAVTTPGTIALQVLSLDQTKTNKQNPKKRRERLKHSPTQSCCVTTPAVTGKGGTKKKITLQTEDHTR